VTPAPPQLLEELLVALDSLGAMWILERPMRPSSSFHMVKWQSASAGSEEK